MGLFLAFIAGIIVCGFLAFVMIRVFAKTQEDKFKVIAQEILQTNSEQFQKTLMSPLKDYQAFISQTHDKDVKERASIQEKISSMIESAKRIEKETHQLTQALTTDVKFQGDWGELTLERILELSGLEKEREYTTQSCFDFDGKKLRPDVVINLPNDTHIVIDSKVSLKSYFNYLASGDETDLKDLKDSTRKHIDQLSRKNYQLIPELRTPGFVYLFVPVEGIYGILLKNFSELIEEAIHKNIIIVSPLTLIANLKTISGLWRIDKQSKSAVEIAEKAGAMYDKFAQLVEDFNKLGVSLKKSQDIHHELEKRIFSGRGNLMERAQELKEKGAKTSKQLFN